MSSVHEGLKHNSSTDAIDMRNNPHLSCASKELTDAYEYAKNSYSEEKSSTMKQFGSSLAQAGDNINNSAKNTQSIATQIQQRILSSNQQPTTAAEQALNTITGFISYLAS